MAELFVGEPENLSKGQNRDAARPNSIAVIINSLSLPNDEDTLKSTTQELDELLNDQVRILKGIGYDVRDHTRKKTAEIRQIFGDLQNELIQRNDVNDVFILFTGFVRNRSIIDCENTTIQMKQIVNDLPKKISNVHIHLYLMLTDSLKVADPETTDLANGSAPLNMKDFISASHAEYRQRVVQLGNENGLHFYSNLHRKVNVVFSAFPIWLGPVEDHRRFSSQCSFSVIVESVREGREGQRSWSTVAETIRDKIFGLSGGIGLQAPIVITGEDFHL